MDDGGVTVHVLSRLRAQVGEAVGLTVFAPERWHSAAQRACAVRLAELQRDLDDLSSLLERAVEQAATAAEAP